MIIGVTGCFAAGKDTFAAYLESQGFKHVSLSDLLREELRKRGLEINIPNLTRVGNELRRKQGNGVLGILAARQLQPGEDAVVSSIRHPGELLALRENAPDFTMVFVDAPQRVRFERSLARRREGDASTFEEFAAQEAEQLQSGDPAAQQLLACRELADFEIGNGGEPDEFHREIDTLIERLRQSKA